MVVDVHKSLLEVQIEASNCHIAQAQVFGFGNYEMSSLRFQIMSLYYTSTPPRIYVVCASAFEGFV